MSGPACKLCEDSLSYAATIGPWAPKTASPYWLCISDPTSREMCIPRDRASLFSEQKEMNLPGASLGRSGRRGCLRKRAIDEITARYEATSVRVTGSRVMAGWWLSLWTKATWKSIHKMEHRRERKLREKLTLSTNPKLRHGRDEMLISSFSHPRPRLGAWGGRRVGYRALLCESRPLDPFVCHHHHTRY